MFSPDPDSFSSVVLVGRLTPKTGRGPTFFLIFHLFGAICIRRQPSPFSYLHCFAGDREAGFVDIILNVKQTNRIIPGPKLCPSPFLLSTTVESHPFLRLALTLKVLAGTQGRWIWPMFSNVSLSTCPVANPQVSQSLP